MNLRPKKYCAVLALGLALVLAGCSGLPTLPGLGGDSKPQSISRPAVESGELQFTHPAAGDTIAVFDTSAGVFKAVLFPSEAPQAYDNFAGLVQSGYYNGLTVSRVEKDFLVEAGQGADGKGTTIWNGSRCPIEVSDKLHHYSGALCMATDTSGQCASVFYVMDTLPGSDSVTQELVDQMNAASYRAEVVSAYQTAGGAPYLDYTDTVLGQILDDGIKYGCASACIPACYVKQAAEYVEGKLPICTVIGFPNGYHTTATKIFETRDAVANGADEIDMVINIGFLKDKRYDEIEQEIRKIHEACSGKTLKVIIETCLLTDEEKIKMCEIVTNAGAGFIKTSTAGATFSDVELMRQYVGTNVKVKAAGGISSFADAEKFIELGADRLGTSRLVKIMKHV